MLAAALTNVLRGAHSDYPLPMGIERKKTDISEWDYRLGRGVSTCSHSGPIALARGFAVPRHDAISNPAAAREPLVKRCAEWPKKTPDGAVLVRRK